MNKVQIIIAYWKDPINNSGTHVACSAVHEGGKQKVTTTHYPPSVPTFDAWMDVLFKEVTAQWKIARESYAPITFEIVTHAKLTKNETSSIRSLMRTYNRFAACEIDDTLIYTAQRLVVSGKKMTTAMQQKQELIQFMLMCKQRSIDLSFNQVVLTTTTRGKTTDRFMVAFECARSSHIMALTAKQEWLSSEQRYKEN